jgi:poly [ADP-ribose] polymerase
MSVIDEYCNVSGNIIEPYTCTLNQTDVESNKNKFYIMQLIKNSDSNYYVYIRYGRVGEPGMIITHNYTDQSDAIEFFSKQFKTKTSNTFGKPFVKKSGKYFLTETEKPTEIKSDQAKGDKEDNKVENKDEKIESRLKYFLELISNEKMLADTLVKLNIDAKKMPLGKISSSQLDEATSILAKLKTIVTSKTFDSSEITNLTSQFYTLVPHSFGRKKPTLLESQDLIDASQDLIDELRNVQVTYNIIKSSGNAGKLTNVYEQMGARIESLDKSSQMYSELVKYVANTQASTHHCNLQVIDVYQVSKPTDTVYDEFTKNMKNKMLLFHGSPISNWCSIIKNGLLLDPSKLGVTITGKMFGYGIYWANSVSKSFNYCGVDSSRIAVLAIGEVALGEIYQQTNANYNLSQKTLDSVKKNSTQGMGSSSPSSVTVIDGVGIPNGKLTKNSKSYSLLYDEFIIYNTNQYKIKYLIVLKNVA